MRLLREHYAELPQPEGDVTLADCYQAANDLPHAAEFYQRVYYHYLSGAAASRAAVALITLKDAMGSSYPRARRRATAASRRSPDGGRRVRAGAEGVPGGGGNQTGGVEHDQALVRMGAADYLAGTNRARPGRIFAGSRLPIRKPRRNASTISLECARRRNDDAEMMSTVQQLAARFRQSPWRLKALTSAANRYLLLNRPENYVPLYQAVYQDFPAAPPAALSHWKVTFQAYLHDREDASRLLREHLRQYSGHSSAGAALYFLGRRLERYGRCRPGRAPAIRSWPRPSRITTTRCWPATA